MPKGSIRVYRSRRPGGRGVCRPAATVTRPGPRTCGGPGGRGSTPPTRKRRAGFRRPGVPAPELPAVLGGEVAGVVEEVGDGISGFAIGDPVFGNPVTGGYAEYALLPAELAARKPADVCFTYAATLPIAAATAYDGINQLGWALGTTLLITGVGGGVGVAAAQRPHRRLVVRVIGTASRGKKDFVEALGFIDVGNLDSVSPAGSGSRRRAVSTRSTTWSAPTRFVGGGQRSGP